MKFSRCIYCIQERERGTGIVSPRVEFDSYISPITIQSCRVFPSAVSDYPPIYEGSFFRTRAKMEGRRKNLELPRHVEILKRCAELCQGTVMAVETGGYIYVAHWAGGDVR